MIKTKDVISRLLILVAVVVLVGCKRGATATPSSVSPLQQVQQSPLQAVSPVATAAPPEIPTPSVLLGEDFDLTQAVLTADDMSDLFTTTYNIAQPFQRDGMRGIQVLYPTRIIEHTSGFVEGFATQIEVYDEFSNAVKAYRAALTTRNGEPLEMGKVGDESQAFEILSDMPGVYVWEVVVRKNNALAIITLKTPELLETAELERIAGIVVERLTP